MALTQAQIDRLLAIRAAMDTGVSLAAAQGAAEINSLAGVIRPWTPGSYAAGDVRMQDGIPYKCVSPHDSAENPAWTPSATPALWMQYHGTSRETARPFVAVTGAHDIYRSGEWMIWQATQVYECVSASGTAYGPDVDAASWILRETIEQPQEPENPDAPDQPDTPDQPETPDEPDDEYPEFVQPTGAHDAYKADDKITYKGKRYICNMDGCVWSPEEYPAAWSEVGGGTMSA